MNAAPIMVMSGFLIRENIEKANGLLAFLADRSN